MDKESLISNIETYCLTKGIKPTPACIEAGVGRNFLIDIKRDRIPSVAKVSQLAAYLGVTTSDLVGDQRAPPSMDTREDALLRDFRLLNDEGKKKAVDYTGDLVASGRYTVSGPHVIAAARDGSRAELTLPPDVELPEEESELP